MRKKIEKQYILNRETLDYELVEQPSRMRKSIKAVLLYGLSSVSLFVLMLYLMAEVYQVPTPRRMLVERESREWHSKLDILERRLESAGLALQDMERRDNMLYRSVFGMETIPDDIRNAGYGGEAHRA